MVEHNLSVVADLCDRITVLTRGRVLAEGDYASVSANPEVREAYLGVGQGTDHETGDGTVHETVHGAAHA
jgi:ABC-type uncharacterized transport system ATPase subunit